MKFRVGYISLGCAKNQVDLEYLIGNLASCGFVSETDLSKCDAVIINTCGFIESAVKESIDAILGASSAIQKGAKLIVAGCMVSRYKSEILKEMPEVDFIAEAGSLYEVAVYLRELAKIKEKGGQKYDRVITNYPYYAYVKIAEGCDNCCAYCKIPEIRGHLKSRAPEDIKNEVSALVANNVDLKEIIIVAQDITKYGADWGERNLVDLLKMLAFAYPYILFRLMYLNPDGVTRELIKLVADTPNIVKYFDIPVQHASNKILKSMGRLSDIECINSVFDTIHSTIPQAFIRTTFIVGFPGETEEDFQSMLQFIEEKKPDFAGFFPYSKEDGTRAAAMRDVVPKSVVQARLKKLQSAQKKNTVERLKGMRDNPFVCFVEKENDDFSFILEGRAIFQAPDVDGKLFVTDGAATNGYGPYSCHINKIAYPDVYVTLESAK